MHFVRVRRFVVVIPHNVLDGRLRFLNRFSGLVNRDVVLLGRFRVLGQIQLHDGVIHLHDFREVLATSISDLRGQLLGILIHQIQRLDHFERVLVARHRQSFINLRFQRTSSATMLVFNKAFGSCCRVVVELWCCWATRGLPLRASVYRGY